MIKKFRKAISLYFLFYPRSSKLSEFKDELLGVMMDNYNELIANGTAESVAYKSVIDTLENYKETAEEIARLRKDELTGVQRKVFFMAEIVFFAFALALYFIVSAATGAWDYTWLVFIVWACISLIGLFFFILAKVQMNSMYILVRCSILIITMLTTTLLYMLISFITKVWAATWTVYILGLGVAYIIDIFFRQHHKAMHFTIFDWLVISMLANLGIYFGLSFGIVGMPWSWSWVCFIVWIFVAVAGIFAIKLRAYQKNGQLKGLFTIPIKSSKTALTDSNSATDVADMSIEQAADSSTIDNNATVSTDINAEESTDDIEVGADKA